MCVESPTGKDHRLSPDQGQDAHAGVEGCERIAQLQQIMDMGLVSIHGIWKIKYRVLERMFLHHHFPAFGHLGRDFLHHFDVGRIRSNGPAKIFRYRISGTLEAEEKNLLSRLQSQPGPQRCSTDAGRLVLQSCRTLSQVQEGFFDIVGFGTRKRAVPTLSRIGISIHQKSRRIEKTGSRQSPTLGDEIRNPSLTRLAIEPKHGLVRIGIVKNHAIDLFPSHPFAEPIRTIQQCLIRLKNLPPTRLDIPRTGEGVFPK